MSLRRFIKWSLSATCLALAALAGLLVVNTLRLAAPDAPAAATAAAAPVTREASERLAAAIRFDTRSIAPGVPQQPEAFLAFHAFLERSYPRVHGALDRERVNDFSLIYRWEGTDAAAKPILLIAHQDVVPPNGDWSRPAFGGLIEDDHVWGRGALDDKVSVLGILEAVEALIAGGFQPSRTIYLAFGHDEEIDGANGAQAIAELFRARGVQFAFVLDEGSPIGHGLVPGVETPVALIGTSEKGYLSLEFNAHTSGGHSSVPSRASAMRVMTEAMIELWRISDRGTIAPPFSDTLDALAPHMGFLPRLILANRWLFDSVLIDLLMAIPEAQAMIATTGTVTVIKAGDTDNVMPSHARAVVNYRLLPGRPVDLHLKMVREALDASDISVEVLGEASDPSPVADPASREYALLANTVRQVFPDVLVAPALVLAATDARHYVGVADQVFRFLPTRLGPEDVPRMHGVDERITVGNYAEIITFYTQLIRNFAAPD